MAVHQIIEIPDPRLRTISAPVAEVTDATRALVADMFDSMYAARGIGLAAIQIGVPERVLVIDLQEDGEDGKPVKAPRVFINPEIVETAPDLSVYTEGCLSVPDQYADVERPATCRVRWLDEQGGAHDEQLEGLLATCIQHEMDHLEGIVFIDHLSRLKREMVLKKLAKARKAAA
ncbi:MAG: peptide deformylase [Sphingomonas sp.]|uniref:peptide deformylase n=1 Tax=Sphingomonas sp. TaxID=28214 RepID=UPI0025D93DBB|nr:peptide deformylase [Sphingomonas sp.]MBY0284475.1 peptide deformylase [Sphingomonas sp.]